MLEKGLAKGTQPILVRIILPRFGVHTFAQPYVEIVLRKQADLDEAVARINVRVAPVVRRPLVKQVYVPFRGGGKVF